MRKSEDILYCLRFVTFVKYFDIFEFDNLKLKKIYFVRYVPRK
jgi:hypothetical protein